MSKQCSKCKEIKEQPQFSISNQTKDGYSSWCKGCKKISMDAWKQANPEKAKIYETRRQGSDCIRIATGKKAAKERNYVWELTKDQWRALVIGKTCHYCQIGALPKTGCGLDRKDNNLGYTMNNVVPCCHSCNRMKGKYLTYEEMMLIWNNRRKFI